MEETKSKKKTKFIIICCSILSAILISIFVRFYIIGGSVYNEEVSCKAKVEGNKVTLVANTIDSSLACFPRDCKLNCVSKEKYY